MKKIIHILLITGMCLSQCAMANNDCIVIGFHEPNTHTYDGPTFCKNVNFKNIIVRGPLLSTQSTITGKTDVSGPIEGVQAVFDTIVSENNHSDEVVSLKKNTIVNGNIIFLGKMSGKVYVDNTSSILGKIINGSVQKRVR